MASKSNNKAKGDEFERRVASYYEALGYQVTRDVRLGGHQIDIVARKYIPGATTVTLAIEAKWRTETVGINIVTPFINTAKHLIGEMHATGAVLVTNSKISPDARGAVSRLDSIRLINIRELEQDLFNNSESLLRITRDLEKQAVFSVYYPLRADQAGKKHSDAAASLQQWASENKTLLILLGDFGSGKSTVLDRVFYESAKRRLEEDSLFPVMLRLRNLRQFTDLWQFIETSLRDNQYLTPPRSVFDAELKAGRLLILLDGFDEIHTGASAADRAEFLNFLKPLLTSASPCILTSRPTFFDSVDEMIFIAKKALGRQETLDRLPSFGVNRAKLTQILRTRAETPLERGNLSNVLNILQLDDEQVTLAIRARAEQIKRTTGMSVERFKNFLYDIYDLQDLMRRPLLLNMILETVTTGAIDLRARQSVGPSTLYDIYTQGAAIRDDEKGKTGQHLQVEQRLDACRTMSMQMLRKREIVLSGVEVAACVQQTLRRTSDFESLATPDDIGRAVTDVRTCSFLRFSDDGSLGFTHTSYFEFFVAQEIYLASTRSREAFLQFSALSLTKEIYYFLGSYARDQDGFRQFLRICMNQPLDAEDKSFVYRIVFASAVMLSRATLSGGKIEDAEIYKASVAKAGMSNVALNHCNMRNVEASEWTLSGVRGTDLSISRTTFDRCRLRISAQGLELSECGLYGSWLELTGGGIRFDGCLLDGSSLAMDGECTCVGLDATDKSILLIRPRALFSSLTDCSFQGCNLHSRKDGRWYGRASRVDIKECLLSGLWLDGRDVVLEPKLGASNRIRLKDCRGVALISLTNELARSDGYKLLKDNNPKLVLVDARLLAAVERPTPASSVTASRTRSGSIGPDLTAAIGRSRREALEAKIEFGLKDSAMPNRLVRFCNARSLPDVD